MDRVVVELPWELAQAAGLGVENASVEAARLLAVELYREEKVSLGRAAELCRTPLEEFLEFVGRHEAPVHYGPAELEEDRRTLERLGL